MSGESATSSARLSRPLIAASGRAIVVWLAVAVIASTVRPLDTGGLMAVTLVAAVWLLSLRAATSSAPYATDCVSSAEKLSYDFWYMRHNNLAVDLAVCTRTLLLMLEVLDPRQLRPRRRPAGGDALR